MYDSINPCVVVSNCNVGLFPMCADILHAGHCMALKQAKKHCNKLIVALNCKPDNKNPIQSVHERYFQLISNKYVDEVIPYMGEEDLKLVLMSTDYQVRFVGEDYKNKYHTGKDYEESKKIKIVYLERQHNLSSTELKERILNSKN